MSLKLDYTASNSGFELLGLEKCLAQKLLYVCRRVCRKVNREEETWSNCFVLYSLKDLFI